MTDWNLLATARQLGIPAGDLPRVTAPLAALESEFRALVIGLPESLDPAVVFHRPQEREP